MKANGKDAGEISTRGLSRSIVHKRCAIDPKRFLTIGGTVGATANVAGQLCANGGSLSQVNPRDAAMAFYTGALTYGATFWPSLFVNTLGAVTISAVNDASPSGAQGNIGGAAFGTALGYPVGVVVQGGLNGALNPWYRSMWQDVGYTMQRWVGASALPGLFGTAASSALQEVGNAAVNANSAINSLERPTRGGQ